MRCRARSSSPAGLAALRPGPPLTAVSPAEAAIAPQAGQEAEPEAARIRPTGMHTWTRRRAGYGPTAGRGPARRPDARSVSRLAAALAIAATAAVGCSSMAAAAPTHPDGHDSPSVPSCSARRGWAAITLTDSSPAPVVTAAVGAHIVVTVPRWGTGRATDVYVARSGILREDCTVLLPDHGRRTIFLAIGPGRTRISATVEPASSLFMPAWAGEVIVRDARH